MTCVGKASLSQRLFQLFWLSSFLWEVLSLRKSLQARTAILVPRATKQNLLTTDKWILRALSGYKIPFLRPPHQWRTRPTVLPEKQPTKLIKGAIQSLISKGAISVVNLFPQQFISILFLVEKGQGTGEFRPVINPKALNRFLPKEKFKMERFHTARSLLRKGDHMMKLDLKDAYYVVLIHPKSRKYLRLQFKGKT